MAAWVIYTVIGVAFLLVLITILILIWLIKTSNKLVVLKKAVDRNYPLINGKIREYCELTEKTVDFIVKKTKKETRSAVTIKKLKQNCLDGDGLLNRTKIQRELAEKLNAYVSRESKNPELKNSRKLKQNVALLNETEDALIKYIQKYNECVENYNKLRSSRHGSIISTRFKFGEGVKWDI